MPLADVDEPRDPLAALRIQRTDSPQQSRSGSRWLRRFLVLFVLVAVAAGGLFAAWRTGWLDANLITALQPRFEVRVSSVSVTTGRAGDAIVVATATSNTTRSRLPSGHRK